MKTTEYKLEIQRLRIAIEHIQTRLSGIAEEDLTKAEKQIKAICEVALDNGGIK